MKIRIEELDRREAYKVMSGVIVPRPIAFISTVGEDGVYNIAPYSAFTNFGVKPAIVCFSVAPRRDGRKKDTLKNAEDSGEFVINMVTEEIAEAMNVTCTGYPSDVDEFKEAGLTPLKSDIVKAPRLAESPVNMECRTMQILEFGEEGHSSKVVIGEIVLIHVRDDFCSDGEIRFADLKPVGRLGGNSYCRTTDMFDMIRPASSYD